MAIILAVKFPPEFKVEALTVGAGQRGRPAGFGECVKIVSLAGRLATSPWQVERSILSIRS